MVFKLGISYLEHFTLSIFVSIVVEYQGFRRPTHHRVHELDTVVLGRVVARGDHDTNGLAIELPRAQGSQQADTIDDGVQKVPVVLRAESAPRSNALTARLGRDAAE